jgi:hypothetical protein
MGDPSSGEDVEGAIGELPLPDGRVLRRRVTGPSHAPTLLWLHGGTGTSCTTPVIPGVRVLS